MSRQRDTTGTLHQAVEAEDLDGVRRLLAGGVDPDERDDLGRTPLMYAAVNGMLDVAEALLQAGANPDAHDGEAWYAMHFAAQASHRSMLELLLQHGATVDSLNSNGNTALWVAAMFSKGDVSAIECLLSRGADPDRHNRHGVSARDLLVTTPEAMTVLARHPRHPT